MNGVDTYSPQDVILSLGGYNLAGWDSITVTRRTFGFKTIPGIRGKHTRVPSGDTSASVAISLIQTSPSNDVLSEVHRIDLLTGTGRLNLTLKDLSGRSVFSSDEAYIVAYPEATFAGEIEYRTWTFFCQTTKSYVVGGNTRPQTNILDAAINQIQSNINNIF